MIPVLYLIALIALIISSITDIKTREVPDWLSYSLIFIGLGARLLYSIIKWDYWIFIYGIIGFAIFLVLALLMYYTGQWGGGDSKVLMGLGALIGFNFDLIYFLILILLVGAVYGIVWSGILAVFHRKEFAKKFVELNLKHMKIKKILLAIALMLFIISFFVDIFFKFYLLVLILIILIFFYILMFAKSVELVCMYKTVPVERLTEGDWIVNDVIVDGERICGPKDLGIEKKKIERLKELNVKEVLIKQGIPFIPSFLIAFVISLLLDYYGILFLSLFVV